MCVGGGWGTWAFLPSIVLKPEQGGAGATGKKIEHERRGSMGCMPPSTSGGPRVSYLQLEGGRSWGG